MSELQINNDNAVDRREETVVTQQPGYATTEQTVRDMAAERRMNIYQVTRLIWTILAVLEISSVIAMVVYALLAWVIERLVWVLFYRPRSATVNTQTTVTDTRTP